MTVGLSLGMSPSKQASRYSYGSSSTLPLFVTGIAADDKTTRGGAILQCSKLLDAGPPSYSLHAKVENLAKYTSIRLMGCFLKAHKQSFPPPLSQVVSHASVPSPPHRFRPAGTAGPPPARPSTRRAPTR